MTAIATDFGRFSNNTLWNRTTDRKYYGPITGSQWQQIKAVVSGGITNYFRIRGGKLLMSPTPTAGESVKFEYVSKNWVDTSGGSTANADKFTADSQTTVLEEELIVLGVVRPGRGEAYFAHGRSQPRHTRTERTRRKLHPVTQLRRISCRILVAKRTKPTPGPQLVVKVLVPTTAPRCKSPLFIPAAPSTRRWRLRT
jgi:hypothetical protein